jgi:predicted permease
MAGMPDWVAGLLARARSTYRGLASHADVEQELREEFQHHLAERTDDLVRGGLSRDEAERLARREFGHQGTHRAEARVAMGLASIARLRVSWLDVTYALRLLRKHPMLNLAAVFALAIGIPVGLAPSHIARALEAPLPGDSGNRLRAIRYWDPAASRVAPTWDAEFTTWAATLRSFSSLGAFRTATVNIAADEQAAPAALALSAAQVTASVFPMLGARPILGRVFDAGDFTAGAPDVVVIGHALWSARFARDPAVLGRSIRIGRTLHVVVGVMPDGFAFPAGEALWLPLRLFSSGGAGTGVPVHVLGRLAEGISAGQAQAELASLGPLRLAATSETEVRARLQPQVVPFGLLFLGLPAGGLSETPEFRYAQALMFALMLVAAGNVAMLVFARTATRLRELAIRTALGASRTRIVSQIFLETLLLAIIAAGVGVLAIDWAIDHVNLAALAGESALPYWLSLGLTRETVLAALGFAAVSATVAGVMPAIAITGRAIAQNMRAEPRVRFGRLTGALVVADIAVSVAAVGMAFAVAGHATDLGAADRATGIPASEYLAVEVRLPEDARSSVQRELVALLEREPQVRRVAVADVLPRMEHRSVPYELDGVDRAADATLRWTRLARVDVEFLAALDAPIRSGRDFVRTDAENGTAVAIVNTAFVERVLTGSDPIGRRVRLPAPGTGSPSWYEIVGVVGPLGVNVVNPDRGEAVYLPAAEGTLNPMQLAVHVVGPPGDLTSRVHELARAVDPDLVVGQVAVLSDVRQGDWYLVMGLAAGLMALVAVLIALATSGLFAMLSLAVSERTREIGIRSAIGAPRRALLLTILRRSLVQVGLGTAIGLPLAGRFVFELTSGTDGGGSPLASMALALSLSLGLVLLVGLGAFLVPARRILAVEASEAMHAGD